MTETAAMLSLSSSLCLTTVFVDGMGFVTPPLLRHLSPVPSHDGQQYRPHARLRMVIGRRARRQKGGIKRFGGWGGGRYGCNGNGFKIVSCFRASFLKAWEAPLKKRKGSEMARPQFWFWIKIRVKPIYLVIFFIVAPPTHMLIHHIFPYHAFELIAAAMLPNTSIQFLSLPTNRYSDRTVPRVLLTNLFIFSTDP